MKIWSSKTSEGFALPTVIITSVVMMIVLLVGLSSLSSISSTLDTQRQGQLAREAARAGIKLAQRCIDLGMVNWTDASPLRPGRGCSGSTTQSTTANFYVVYDAALNQRTTFTVGAPVSLGSGGYLIQANGIYETKRSSSATATTKSVGASVSLKYVVDASATAAVSDSGNLLVCAVVRNIGELKNQVYCWGDNKDGRTGVGFFNSGFAACNNASPSITYLVTDNTCAVTKRGQVKRDESSTVGGRQRQLLDHEVDVTAGGGFACTISENTGGFTSRRVFCWGSNNKDRLGAGVSVSATTAGCKNIPSSEEPGEEGEPYVACNTPVQVKPQWNIDDGTYYPYDIVTGTAHACVLAKTSNSATATGRVYCWGARGPDGKLGDGTTGGSSDTPVRVHGVDDAGFLNAKQIGGSGGAAICAINGADIVVCWGNNDHRQLGQGINDTTSRPYPVAVLVQGESDYMTASKVVVQGAVESVGAESGHACAIGKNTPVNGPNVQTGKIYCWGSNQYGQQGDGIAPSTGAGKAKLITRVYSTPSDTGTTSYAADDIAVANKSTCAIITVSAVKSVYCWGSHNQGQLGVGPPPNFPVPSPCSAGPTSAGVYCDASSTDGENEPVRSQPLPADLGNLGDDVNNLVSINGGAIRFCLIAGVNNYCWGRNHVGQIGDGTVKSPRSKPKASAFLNIVGEQVYF